MSSDLVNEVVEIKRSNGKLRVISVETQACGEDLSLILRIHPQKQGCPLVYWGRQGWINGAHWPASLDNLTRFGPVRDHLQRGTPAEVVLQLPHAPPPTPAPHTEGRMKNSRGKAKTEAI